MTTVANSVDEHVHVLGERLWNAIVSYKARLTNDGDRPTDDTDLQELQAALCADRLIGPYVRVDEIRGGEARNRRMKTLREQVSEFHRAVGQPILDTPQVPDEKRVRLRAALMAEEFFEVLEALFQTGDGRSFFTTAKKILVCECETVPLRVDMPALVDGLADLDYVVEGTRLEFGIDGAPVADEVHATNMAKAGGPRLPNGKIGKPEGWKPPDIEGVLLGQGWHRG
jgi:predicted HAD superfamily Cof-like phosphohydrolase